MSDFTRGNLILQSQKELAKKHLEPQSYLLNLNSKWVCRLARTDDQINLNDPVSFSQPVLELSTHTPVLFFDHPEDHGFGYAILHKKAIVSSLFIPYEFEHWPANQDKELARIFSHAHLEPFRLLGFSGREINQLKTLFTPETFDEGLWDMAADFMQIIHVMEMSFIAWRYVESHEELYPLLAKQ